MLKKICVVTGTRADYGLLYWLLHEIKADPALDLQIIATGMHLSPEFGLTYETILKDGFTIDAKVEMLLSSDSSVGITKSIGLGIIGFADAFERLKPDMVVLLGDRFETLAAAQAAFIAGIPIAHIHGGELTLGAYDDGIRHSISKMSHLHFVATQEYRRRVIQLGEEPSRVHFVGAMVIDSICQLALLDRPDLEKELAIKFNRLNFLITYHPETLDTQSPAVPFNALLQALTHFPDATLIFSKGNADSHGRIINSMIEDFCQEHPNAKAFTSLGFKNYLSLLKMVDVVVGNSSSGIIEAPYFKTPTVNMGDRQKGRIRSLSVIDCTADEKAIVVALQKALSPDWQSQIKEMKLLYGEGSVARKIVNHLKDFPLNQKQKPFYDLKVE